MTLELPSEKQSPSLSPETVKALLFGVPKVGKSTFAAQLDPDHTLFLATEPGLGALEVFAQPVTTWTQFREAGAALAQDHKQFRTLVVDTVDELYRMCSDYVCAGFDVNHPSDLEYGKVWAAVGDEWRLRVGKLAGLGLGVWFISHAKETEVPARVGKITKIVPTLSGQARGHVLGFCDFIFLARIESDGEEQKRLLQTAPSEQWEAGGRVPPTAKPLPNPLPLDAAALRKAMAETFAAPTANGSQPKPAAKTKRQIRKREAVSR